MQLLGLRTCIYHVSDIQKAKDWYSEVLGFAPYFDEPFYVGFDVAGYELGLQPTDSTNQSKPESVSTYWGVEDIVFYYQNLLNLGATPHEEPTDVGSNIKVTTVKDPWGNLFGIIFNPHFKV